MNDIATIKCLQCKHEAPIYLFKARAWQTKYDYFCGLCGCGWRNEGGEGMKDCCKICLHWSTSIGIGISLEWGDDENQFEGDGICHKHSSMKDGKALAICDSEGITGEFITKKDFSCSEFGFDKNHKQRLLDENQEHYDFLKSMEERSQQDVERALQEIRDGIENGIYVEAKAWPCPKGLNSITDLLTEDEKRQYRKLYGNHRELEVERRIKEQENITK